MHRDLANDWTLESLAKISGMSRSAFAARFKEKAGQTALDYLIRWRMHKAAHLIRRTDLSLNEIAEHIGYQSEAAFNRMFKREVGTTPGRFKRASSDGLEQVHPPSV
jgi:AraC-like DNA-binding protein